MTDDPSISDAEWEVMNVLWESSPRTASEVAEQLCTRMNWHPKTVKTLLARLVKKGALRFRVEGNRYFYRPVFSREKFVRVETRSFIDRVFGGQTTPMLAHFVENGDLTPEDLESLKEILERSRK
jgi:BlaI family penicillinase repressor